MTHRERLETAWSHEEPDRVPIELRIEASARTDPRAARLVELMDEHADNFFGARGYDWGFMGWPSSASKRVIEECPGEFTRWEHRLETPAGDFTAVARVPDDEEAAYDCHWEKRYITSPADLERLLDVPLEVREVTVEAFERTVANVGERGVVHVSLLHPLGFLVRHATMEEVYTWFVTHGELMHRLIEATTEHVVRATEAMMAAGIGPYFMLGAHEMLIPPWAGMKFFDEFVLPYDRRVGEVIHRHGGKLRIHCHGNAMDYLERFVEMGVDSMEPLEAAPLGDVDLAEAKRRVGDRMLLSGNVPSPYFINWGPDQVRDAVREAIRAAARGGGFSLRTTGGTAGTNAVREREQLGRIIANCEAYIAAGLEFGQYPIRL